MLPLPTVFIPTLSVNDSDNDAQEKCEYDYCFDCEKLYDEFYPCDCIEETILELNKSLDGNGYNYCYDCSTVIYSNTNNKDLCTCIRDGKLPQNAECFDCGERHNIEGEEPCDCIQEMQPEIWGEFATKIQSAWRRSSRILTK